MTLPEQVSTPTVVSLVCHDCDAELALSEADAREIADGTVCLSCPDCHVDLAIAR